MATCSVHRPARCSSEPRGESLLVIGAPPTIKVHIHTDNPEKVQDIAARHGTAHARQSRQHGTAAQRARRRQAATSRTRSSPSFPARASSGSCASSAPKSTVAGEKNPSVRDLLLAVNKTLGNDVYLFVNDKNVALAASEVRKLTDKQLHVIPTRRHRRRHRGAFRDADSSRRHACRSTPRTSGGESRA